MSSHANPAPPASAGVGSPAAPPAAPSPASGAPPALATPPIGSTHAAILEAQTQATRLLTPRSAWAPPQAPAPPAAVNMPPPAAVTPPPAAAPPTAPPTTPTLPGSSWHNTRNALHSVLSSIKDQKPIPTAEMEKLTENFLQSEALAAQQQQDLQVRQTELNRLAQVEEGHRRNDFAVGLSGLEDERAIFLEAAERFPALRDQINTAYSQLIASSQSTGELPHPSVRATTLSKHFASLRNVKEATKLAAAPAPATPAPAAAPATPAAPPSMADVLKRNNAGQATARALLRGASLTPEMEQYISDMAIQNQPVDQQAFQQKILSLLPPAGAPAAAAPPAATPVGTAGEVPSLAQQDVLSRQWEAQQQQNNQAHQQATAQAMAAFNAATSAGTPSLADQQKLVEQYNQQQQTANHLLNKLNQYSALTLQRQLATPVVPNRLVDSYGHWSAAPPQPVAPPAPVPLAAAPAPPAPAATVPFFAAPTAPPPLMAPYYGSPYAYPYGAPAAWPPGAPLAPAPKYNGWNVPGPWTGGIPTEVNASAQGGARSTAGRGRTRYVPPTPFFDVGNMDEAHRLLKASGDEEGMDTMDLKAAPAAAAPVAKEVNASATGSGDKADDGTNSYDSYAAMSSLSGPDDVKERENSRGRAAAPRDSEGRRGIKRREPPPPVASAIDDAL